MGELFQHNLNPFIKKYDCRVFVETGTGVGTGVEYALKYSFDQLYTIEIINELYEVLVEDIALVDERLMFINGSSIDGLARVFKNEDNHDRNILFWLDAHFPGADFNFNDYSFRSDEPHIHMPLRSEIDMICRHRGDRVKNDCFIIDDLRLFERANYENGPCPSEIIEMIGGYDNQFLIDAFEETHEFKRDYRNQGYLILTPEGAQNE